MHRARYSHLACCIIPRTTFCRAITMLTCWHAAHVSSLPSPQFLLSYHHVTNVTKNHHSRSTLTLTAMVMTPGMFIYRAGGADGDLSRRSTKTRKTAKRPGPSLMVICNKGGSVPKQRDTLSYTFSNGCKDVSRSFVCRTPFFANNDPRRSRPVFRVSRLRRVPAQFFTAPASASSP